MQQPPQMMQQPMMGPPKDYNQNLNLNVNMNFAQQQSYQTQPPHQPPQQQMYNPPVDPQNQKNHFVLAIKKQSNNILLFNYKVNERNQEYYRQMKENIEEMTKLESVFEANGKNIDRKINLLSDKNEELNKTIKELDSQQDQLKKWVDENKETEINSNNIDSFVYPTDKYSTK